MKTFDRKNLYSWSNAEEAKTYLGSQGYFGNSICGINRSITKLDMHTLREVDDSDAHCFYNKSLPFGYCFFLPTDKVIHLEKEKTWRAFKSLDEFADALGVCHIVGTEIIFRNKDASRLLRKSMITEMSTTSNNSFVTLGALEFSLKSLFDAYEWLNKDGTWQPFGVEE